MGKAQDPRQITSLISSEKSGLLERLPVHVSVMVNGCGNKGSVKAPPNPYLSSFDFIEVLGIM